MKTAMSPRSESHKFSPPKSAWNEPGDPQLNTSTVRPHLAYNLSRYYHQTDNEKDKELCLELMEKLSLQRNRQSVSAQGTRNPTKSKLPRRAKTPSHELRSRVPEKYQDSETRNPELFYQTTANRDFCRRYGPPAQNARPRTTEYSQPKLSEDTTYGHEYYRKSGGRSTPYRTGSSSGNRMNNPHPAETFMVWKFASRVPADTGTELAEEALAQINKDNLKSIYQEDYNGLPQGFQAHSAYEGYPSPEWLDKAPYTLNTTNRAIYQTPYMPPFLQGNLTRYGSNGNRGIPSFGVVPTISLNNPYMSLYSRTHYTDEYKDKSEKAFKDLHRKFKPASLPLFEKYLKKAKPEEKEALINLLQAIDEKDRFKEKKDKDWTTVWEGPL